MNFFIQFFYKILYQPILNALFLLYNWLPGHDFGVAVIFLTILIKILLFPVSLKTIKSQKKLNLLQSKIKQIQKKYKHDRQKQSQEIMMLYQKEGINPFSGCLPFLFQLPILIALYQVFLKGLNEINVKKWLYSFVPYSFPLNLNFLGLIDLTKSSSSLVLGLIAGAVQFYQSKLTLTENSPRKKSDLSNLLQNQMLYFFPFLTFFLVWKFGSLIGLYWITSTLLSIGEYYIVKRRSL